MCKIMIAPGAKNAENLWKFAEVIAPKITKHNNDDGLGYAAMDAKGKIFAERWFVNRNAFKDFGLSPGDQEMLKTMGTEMFKEKYVEEYSRFGVVDRKNTVSLLLHARAATTEKNMQNVHPFITKGTALIHNGVIRNHEELTKTMSTCDSEVILHEYLGFNVAMDAEQIHNVIDNLKGYFACGVLTKADDGTPIVDIFKSVAATLYATYVNELKTVVFCTSRFDLEEAIKDLNWVQNKCFELGNDQFIRFNGVTGEKLASFKINSNETYVNNYSHNNFKNDDADREHFKTIVDKFAKEVDWIKMIEEDEARRLIAKQNLMS